MSLDSSFQLASNEVEENAVFTVYDDIPITCNPQIPSKKTLNYNFVETKANFDDNNQWCPFSCMEEAFLVTMVSKYYLTETIYNCFKEMVCSQDFRKENLPKYSDYQRKYS